MSRNKEEPNDSRDPEWASAENDQVPAEKKPVSKAASTASRNDPPWMRDQPSETVAEEGIVEEDIVTPAWAKPSKFTPSKAPPDVDIEAAKPHVSTPPPAAPPASHGGPIPLDIEPDVLAQMKKAHYATRILYITACILMGAAAGLALTPSSQAGTSSTSIAASQGTATNNVGTAFFAAYVLFFCLIMCCFEVGLNMCSSVLAINFGFLYTLSGRLLFLLFVGFMSFSLSIFGIAAMIYLYLVGAVHIGIMLYYPKFSEWVRQKDYFGWRVNTGRV